MKKKKVLLTVGIILFFTPYLVLALGYLNPGLFILSMVGFLVGILGLQINSKIPK